MPSVITEASAKLRRKREKHLRKERKLWKRIAKLERLGEYRRDLAQTCRRHH